MPPSAVSADLVARLDAWLPQTQCTRCGYPRCCAYADARGGSRRHRSMPARWRADHPGAGRAARPGAETAQPGIRRARTTNPRRHRRDVLHRLPQVPRRLPGGCHSRRAQTDAHRDCARVHRLWPVPAAVSGGLHRPSRLWLRRRTPARGRNTPAAKPNAGARAPRHGLRAKRAGTVRDAAARFFPERDYPAGHPRRPEKSKNKNGIDRIYRINRILKNRLLKIVYSVVAFNPVNPVNLLFLLFLSV